MTPGTDTDIRLAAFNRLVQLEKLHGPILPWEVIAQGFPWQGRTLLFANQPRGIFRPVGMTGAALSIKSTTPRGTRERRYPDQYSYDGTLLYRFQGHDPDAFDNQLLKMAYLDQAPLIFFCGVAPGQYRPIWPVYVSDFEPERLRCEVQVGELPGARVSDAPRIAEPLERRYATRQAQQRLHQAAFRYHVLQAYHARCAVCRLPAKALLEAAHIIPDRDELGHAEVPNGLALCRLHHGAFDAELLGIRPDGVIQVSRQLLEARDGPTLELAVKSFHERPLERPAHPLDWPKQDYLEARYEQFLAAQ